MHTAYNIFAVFLGSGLGGVCRWGLGVWCKHLGATALPVGTLAANILGCFAIGALTRALPGGELTRLLLVTGFCGGFTTFSTFTNENVAMLRSGDILPAAAYTAASVFCGLVAAYTGMKIV